MSRANTRVVKIGDRVIGGGNPILIQSMTNTKTEDVEATVKQIQALTEAGCDIIRCAVPTMEAAKALSEIKKQISIPLVADIHFDYRLAIAAIENGADKIRTRYVSIREISEAGNASRLWLMWRKNARFRSASASTAVHSKKSWWKNTTA